MGDEKVTDGWHGEMTWSEAARRDGAPPIAIGGVQLDINGMLDKLKWLGLARMMTGSALMQMPSMIRHQRNKVNDGFFLTRSSAALAGAFFVKPDKAFAAMNKVRDQVLNSRGSKKFVWNLPGEFRFIRVADKATLQPMKPGLWFNAQMISFSDLAESDHAWRKEFKAVEDYWVQELGARPHMGKLWGMEEFPNGDIEPFSHAYACTIYSQAAKDTFNAYREAWDPQGLFLEFNVGCAWQMGAIDAMPGNCTELLRRTSGCFFMHGYVVVLVGGRGQQCHASSGLSDTSSSSAHNIYTDELLDRLCTYVRIAK